MKCYQAKQNSLVRPQRFQKDEQYKKKRKQMLTIYEH